MFDLVGNLLFGAGFFGKNIFSMKSKNIFYLVLAISLEIYSNNLTIWLT